MLTWLAIFAIYKLLVPFLGVFFTILVLIFLFSGSDL